MDFNSIVALFAIIGLLLSIFKWEAQFTKRSFDAEVVYDKYDDFITDIIVFRGSLMGAIGIVLKFYFESIWQNYKNPVAFYKTIV